MVKDKIVKIATHNGRFHSDEVFAIAILKKFYSNIEIIRTRDKKLLSQADIRVDVGGRYDSKTGDFDHHQKDFDKTQKSGIPYSSSGLIWKHFGRKLVNSNEAYEKIRKELMEFLDAQDTGVNYSNDRVQIYSIGDVVDSFNPTWKDKEKENQQFVKALDYILTILENELKRANDYTEGVEITRKAIKENIIKEFIILEKEGLPTDPIIDETNLLYIVSPVSDGNWGSLAVIKKKGLFDNRKNFPKKWGGLTNDELERISGVKGAIFCHKNLFCCVTKTKESAIELTKKAIDIEK